MLLGKLKLLYTMDTDLLVEGQLIYMEHFYVAHFKTAVQCIITYHPYHKGLNPKIHIATLRISGGID